MVIHSSRAASAATALIYTGCTRHLAVRASKTRPSYAEKEQVQGATRPRSLSQAAPEVRSRPQWLPTCPGQLPSSPPPCLHLPGGPRSPTESHPFCSVHWAAAWTLGLSDTTRQFFPSLPFPGGEAQGPDTLICIPQLASSNRERPRGDIFDTFLLLPVPLASPTPPLP